MEKATAEELRKIAGEYASRIMKWSATEYHIEIKGKENASGLWAVWLNHHDDKKLTHNGGGKSISLRIDLDKRLVVEVLRFQ